MADCRTPEQPGRGVQVTLRRALVLTAPRLAHMLGPPCRTQRSLIGQPCCAAGSLTEPRSTPVTSRSGSPSLAMVRRRRESFTAFPLTLRSVRPRANSSAAVRNRKENVCCEHPRFHPPISKALPKSYSPPPLCEEPRIRTKIGARCRAEDGSCSRSDRRTPR